MKGLKKLLLFGSLFLFASTAQASFCGGALGGNKVDGTSGLIIYLSELVDQSIVSEREIKTFEKNLSSGLLVNPISEKTARVNSNYFVHRTELQSYFTKTEIDQKKLSDWLEKFMAAKRQEQLQRTDTQAKTADIDRKIIFHPLPAGSFIMVDHHAVRVEVTLTHPFEMMDTAVTQRQWIETMHHNPSEHTVSWEAKIFHTEDGKEISYLPDHPVENITWWEAAEFANRKSIEANLPPVYDLSNCGDSRACNVPILAPDGDIYRALGYRLPTGAEMEYVLRNLGENTAADFLEDSQLQQSNYAWYDKNSLGQTWPVAHLQSQMIAGNAFYDLYGNVGEWTQDFFEGGVVGGTNPLSPLSGKVSGIRGGYFRAPHAMLTAIPFQFNITKTSKANYIGLRLVRTLP